MLTSEDFKKITNCVKKVYRHNFLLKSEPLEDVLQEAYLLAIENGSTQILSKLLFLHTIDEDKARYVYPKKFSELAPNETEESLNDLISNLKPLYNVYARTVESPVINHLAKVLYDKKDFQERFLDYMSGMSIGSGRARDVRYKLFYHRFDILSTLIDFNAISKREFNRYMEIANALNRVPHAKRKPLSKNKTAERCRKFYEQNKEEQRARLRANYYNRKNLEVIL